MSSTDKLAGELYSLMKESDERKPTPYDTTAEVTRVEEGTVWVHIDGGVDETPVRKTIDAKKGDKVRVHVGKGSAWITGNESAPPTDDTTAVYATRVATTADSKAAQARSVADEASLFASIAKDEAIKAQNDAQIAKDAANVAVSAAETAEENAQTAIENASIAQEQATNALHSAQDASLSATAALNQLGIVEDIVGVLDLISKNGTYEITQDDSVLPDKWYFERVGSAPNYEYRALEIIPAGYFLTEDIDIVEGKQYYTRSGSGTEQDPYVYTEVTNPDIQYISTYYELIASPRRYGYYELTGVQESIQNYVSSHLALTAQGLWVQLSDSSTKALFSPTRGVVLYNTDGQEVAQYGETTVIGKQNGFHIVMGANEQGGKLSFYQGNNEVAYVSNNQLYITQSVVLQQMDIGTPMFNGLGGQWSWKVSPNAEGKNNLYLKWIG